MKLTRIRGIEPDVLRDALAALLEEQGLDGQVTLEHRGVILRNLRLREGVYNYLSYFNDRCDNWYATLDEETGRPICRSGLASLEHRPMRAKYLQWRHWAWLDNAVNELLDEMWVSCTFRSAYRVLRLGDDWTPICPAAYTLYDGDGNAV